MHFHHYTDLLFYAAWRRQNWPPPQILEELSPERTTLVLDMAPPGGASSRWDAHPAVRQLRKEAIIDLLTEQISAPAAEIADQLGLDRDTTDWCLHSLMAEDIVVAEGDGPNRIYRLKG